MFLIQGTLTSVFKKLFFMFYFLVITKTFVKITSLFHPSIFAYEKREYEVCRQGGVKEKAGWLPVLTSTE